MTVTRGAHTYGDFQVHGTESDVTIGKYCSIANSAQFDAGIQHHSGFATTYPLWKIGAPEVRKGMSKGPIVVGNDVWIGDGAFIMSGVNIGDGAIIGARSVVTRDVPAYSVACGSPADFVGWRFYPERGRERRGYLTKEPPPIIQRMLALKWWDFPEDRIRELAPLMLSEDIETFLKAAEA